MRISSSTRTALLAGDVVRGFFGIGGAGIDTPGTLRWSFDGGAEIELIGDTPGWPTGFDRGDHTIHCAIDGANAITVLNARVRTVSMLGRAVRLSATTLALGGHVRPEHRWARAIYGTANLSEWISESGLQGQRPATPGTGPVGMLWSPPPSRQFKLPRADVALQGRAELDPVGLISKWSVETFQTLVVDVRRRRTIDELFSQYALPLVVFTSFAADRPDSVNVEVVRNPDDDERVEVLRRGAQVQPREWQPTGGYLFRAEHLPRLTGGLRRWWRLYTSVWPALDLFAEHVNAGTTYSPARFLTLYTAMEAYCREGFGQHQLRRLRDYAGVADTAHGCTAAALARIGQSRKYFAHLTHAGPATREELSNNLLDTTRQASALMQACLLRELGFGPRQVERLLASHHTNWPLPVGV